MKKRKKTILNILLIVFIVSFFVTPLGYHSKVLLNQLFSGAPNIIETSKRVQLPDYNWKLKDADWNFFNFEKSEGKVVFINFWASWRLPCAAELKSVQELYEAYHEKVDFYIITDELQAPVEEFIAKNDFTFPVTYLIIGERTPLEVLEAPASYIIDKKGNIVVKEEDIADWDNTRITNFLDELIVE